MSKPSLRSIVAILMTVLLTASAYAQKTTFDKNKLYKIELRVGKQYCLEQTGPDEVKLTTLIRRESGTVVACHSPVR